MRIIGASNWKCCALIKTQRLYHRLHSFRALDNPHRPCTRDSMHEERLATVSICFELRKPSEMK